MLLLYLGALMKISILLFLVFLSGCATGRISDVSQATLDDVTLNAEGGYYNLVIHGSALDTINQVRLVSGDRDQKEVKLEIVEKTEKELHARILQGHYSTENGGLVLELKTNAGDWMTRNIDDLPGQSGLLVGSQSSP